MNYNLSDNHIDIREDYLNQKDNLLELLLEDRTSKKNILWATDSYRSKGKGFEPGMHVNPELVTGIYGKVIQPRASKSREEQIRRTREKAEVFTPLWVVKQMNDVCDSKRVTKYNWQEYVALLKLEITCGEAPYIVSRYDPVADSQDVLPLKKRVGFLDRKLQVVSKYCDEHKDWVTWAKIAFQSSYGYEWQGDNLLIARENLLYTFIDFYKNKFNRKPKLNLQKEIVDIIVWNIFQMDGLNYMIPMSKSFEERKKSIQGSLFNQENSLNKKKKTNTKNNYVKVMDWKERKIIRFIDLINN